MLGSKNHPKCSGEYSIKNTFTIDPADIPRSTKLRGSKKSKKGLHKKAESISSVSFSKPKISSTISNSFMGPKSFKNKPEY